MTRTILLFGLSMAILLVAMKWVEFSFFVHDLSLEIYLGIVGVFCTILGVWAGRKLTQPKAKKENHIMMTDPEGNSGFTPENQFGLSPREYEVLVLIANGLSYQEIADRLFISLTTVKTHAANIFSKMDVQRRTQAVMLAQKSGLLPTTKV